MLKLKENKFLIQTAADLPNLQNANELHCDVETKRVFDHKKYGGLYPWKGDRICGVSVSIDDDPNVFYIPVRHTNPKWNIPLAAFQSWLKDTVCTCKDFVNHSVVFDAMFCLFDGAEPQGRMVCVKTMAKLIDSDRMNHELKPLCKDWLGCLAHRAGVA